MKHCAENVLKGEILKYESGHSVCFVIKQQGSSPRFVPHCVDLGDVNTSRHSHGKQI